MKLIREEIESVEFLVEQKNGKKSMYIEGVFLQGNIKNRNGRMYPMETLRREVGRYSENHITSGRALGELGHPEGPTVNLDRVSHKIVSLKEPTPREETPSVTPSSISEDAILPIGVLSICALPTKLFPSCFSEVIL